MTQSRKPRENAENVLEKPLERHSLLLRRHFYFLEEKSCELEAGVAREMISHTAGE
jgi:hypothetical protein